PLGWVETTMAQASPGQASRAAPTDAWPRQVKLSGATAVVYQPQIDSWRANRLEFRAVVAVKAGGSPQEVLGTIWATARTEVDRVARMVTLRDLTLTRSDFPTLADKGASYMRALQGLASSSSVRTIALDRLEASLAASDTVKLAGVEVNNAPPRVIVSESPAILVPIDGPPVQQPVAGTRFERVINTRALILREAGSTTYYLHVYDGWLYAGAITGPWYQPMVFPPGIDQVAQNLARAGVVDLLDGQGATPKPALAQGSPAIYVSETPTELIVFKGPPAFAPIAGTALQWASNTTADVIFDTGGKDYYVLLSGRWYRAPALTAPWTYVASPALPADFRRIPVASPAGVVLASVAGTPQAQEAVIANSIPQTATIPRVNGPTFTPTFDGPPQLRPIAGTPLYYVANSPTPIINVSVNLYYALRAGIWFSATSLGGPWFVAASVPAIIYTIPPTSPLHYVTYVHVYGSTAQVVYIGYTPGYLGTVVTPAGVVVYGTGYAYPTWVGSAWYPPPATYGMMAQPVYNPAAGMAFGFAMGVTTAALVGSAYYHPAYYGYPCCGSTSVNTYRAYGNTVASGTRGYYSDQAGNVGQAASGTYTNYRTGTSGAYSASRSVNPSDGTAQRSYSRTFDTPYGTSGSVSRYETYDNSTGQYTHSSAESATGPGGAQVSSQRTTTTSPYGQASTERQTTVTNPNTGQ
ncbi:MAG TPA: hypothetical protein VL330_27980, partial [Actinomycetes bacterium]|nr:hypothetical protein [Actinomycetes bacterium]